MKGKSTDLIIIASATAQKGKEAELESALRDVTAPTRLQRGCVDFVLIRPKDDPATVIGFERWTSEADHQLHLQGAHVKELMERMGNILAGAPKIVVYDVIDS